MSELVLVFAVIALTAIVLLGLVFTFRRYVRIRDRLMMGEIRNEARQGAGAKAATGMPGR